MLCGGGEKLECSAVDGGTGRKDFFLQVRPEREKILTLGVKNSITEPGHRGWRLLTGTGRSLHSCGTLTLFLLPALLFLGIRGSKYYVYHVVGHIRTHAQYAGDRIYC